MLRTLAVGALAILGIAAPPAHIVGGAKEADVA